MGTVCNGLKLVKTNERLVSKDTVALSRWGRANARNFRFDESSLLKTLECRNWPSVGCLKCVQFHNRGFSLR